MEKSTQQNIKEAIGHLAKAVGTLNDQVLKNGLEITALKEEIARIKNIKVSVRNDN